MDHDAERTRGGEVKSAKDWWPSAAEDMGNPQNWSTAKRTYHSVIPVSVAFLCPFGSSVYTPGLGQVSREFGISREIALFPFVFYLLGLAFGPVIAAPLSETFGRRVVCMCIDGILLFVTSSLTWQSTDISALPLFAAFTLGSGFSNGIASLTICRFFAGAASSPGLSLGSGTVADLYKPHQRALPMSIFVTAVQMGPVCGPLIGGFVTEKLSWRWTQWVILFGIAIVFAVTIPMQETYKLSILTKRAKRLNIEGPPKPNRTPLETAKFFATKTIVRALHMLVTEPIVTLFDLYTAFTFGLLNAFFAAFSWVFQNVYGFSLGSTGLTYLGQAVGSLVGLCVMLYFNRVWARETRKIHEMDPGAKLAPERRLVIAKIGALLLPVGLFWFGWTARSSIHWIVPVVAEAFFSCANILIFTCALMFLQDCYGAQYGASASSSNTFARYLTAFAFPLFAIQMFEGLGTGGACSLLGGLSVLLMPIPFIFDRYGPRIRQKSKYKPDE